MLRVTEVFTDEEAIKLKIAKGSMTWRDFILSKCCEDSKDEV